MKFRHATNALKRNPRESPSPLRVDPTRTSGLRKRFGLEVRRMFARLKAKVVQKVLEEDAFGLEPISSPFSLNVASPADLQAAIDAINQKIQSGSADSSAIQRLLEGMTRAQVEEVMSKAGSQGFLPFGKTKAEVVDRFINQLSAFSRAAMHKEEIAKVTQQGAKPPVPALPPPPPRVADPVVRRPSPITGIWKYKSTPEKIKEFKEWLQKQIKGELGGRDEEALFRRYTEEGLKQGAGRAFDDAAKVRGKVKAGHSIKDPIKVSKPGMGAIPGKPVIKFVPHPRAAGSGQVTIMVDPKKLDADWKKDKSGYLPPLGEGKGESEILGRRERFKEFMAKGEPIQASEVYFGKDEKGEDRVQFQDGRHRFSVMRDEGIDAVAVTVPKKEAQKFLDKYAAPAPKVVPLLPQDQSLDFYKGTKEEFLRSSFNRPVAVERVEILAGRAFDDLEGITERMSRDMVRTLTDGLVQGKNPRGIARSLIVPADSYSNRAEVIARTEVIRAHAEGQLQALEDLGVEEVGVAVEWSTAGDGRVCPRCRALNGIVLKIEEARGMLPLHPQCRCAWLPANVGETKEERKTQKRTKPAIDAAVAKAGLGGDISKDRPKSIVGNLLAFKRRRLRLCHNRSHRYEADPRRAKDARRAGRRITPHQGGAASVLVGY